MRRLIALLLVVWASAVPVAAQVLVTGAVTANSSGSGCTAEPNACVSVVMGNAVGASIDISGTFTGTLTFEALVNQTWRTVVVTNNADGTTATTATAAGAFSFGNVGVLQLRVRATAWTSGTANIAVTKGWAVARVLSPTVNSILVGDGTAAAPGFAFTSQSSTGIFRPFPGYLGFACGGGNCGEMASDGWHIPTALSLGWAASGGANTLVLERDASDVLGLRRGANAQSFRMYETYTDSLNYSRLALQATGTTFDIYGQSAGTGTARPLRLGTSNGPTWQISTGGHFLAVTDNANDIGALAATRPRTGYFGTSVVSAGTTLNANNLTFASGNDVITSTNNLDLTVAASNYVGFNDGVVSTRLKASGFSMYNNVASAGWGVPAVYAAGRFTAQTGAKASVSTYTVGAADGTFEVSANVNVTISTTHTFTVTVAYTDETNTARTLTVPFTQLTGAFVTSITNVTGAGPYESPVLHIRCKAATAITIATTGTFTTVTYNVEGIIKQVS